MSSAECIGNFKTIGFDLLVLNKDSLAEVECIHFAPPFIQRMRRILILCFCAKSEEVKRWKQISFRHTGAWVIFFIRKPFCISVFCYPTPIGWQTERSWRTATKGNGGQSPIVQPAIKKSWLTFRQKNTALAAVCLPFVYSRRQSRPRFRWFF